MDGKKRFKKGLSTVVSTVLMVALTIAAVSVIWVAVNTLVQEKTKSSESCFGVFGKVELNPQYTCYNNTGGISENEVWFSIDRGEIETVDDILVGISGETSSVSFKILEDAPLGLSYYPNRTTPVDIPRADQGLTYIYELPSYFTETPEKVEIALIINGEICGDTDSLQEIDVCSALG
ncbi:MAG: archaellin/type IV pilin N-terminal domain-containing protein [Nanoarchaeota archaeon]